MKLIVLGSGTCIPAPHRGNPGYLVAIDDKLILMDSGAGALRRAADYGYDYRNIHHILYTHLHPDHTVDLVPFLFGLKNDYSMDGTFQIDIIGPHGFQEHYRNLLNVYGHWIDSERLDINIKECTPDERIDLGLIRLSTGNVHHTEHSIAYRLEDRAGHSLVYSGDTGYSDAFIEFAQDTDVLLLECSVPDSEQFDKHLSPSEAGKIAALTNAKTTILTHFYPLMDKEPITETVRQFYQGEIILAEDGLSHEIR